MKSAVVAFVIMACQQVTLAKESAPAKQLSTLDRVIIFAVQQEVHASQIENRKDVCVGLGHGLAVNERRIITELHRKGLKLHPNEWCNQGPRGLVVSVLAPVGESLPSTYELVVELGDLQPLRQDREHFVTLIRRGSYKIKCEGSAEPELVSYSQTCCSETLAPKH